jgi:hypothetical protein
MVHPRRWNFAEGETSDDRGELDHGKFWHKLRDYEAVEMDTIGGDLKPLSR